MELRIGTPYKISLTPFGPTIIYADEYTVAATRNVISGNTTVALTGPGTRTELEGEALHGYDSIWKRMGISGIRYLAREADGVMYADWGGDGEATIGQSMRLSADGGSFSILWKGSDIPFDDGPDTVAAIAAVAREFDPAEASAMIETAAADCTILIEELLAKIA